jgi:plastocyanin
MGRRARGSLVAMTAMIGLAAAQACTAGQEAAPTPTTPSAETQEAVPTALPVVRTDISGSRHVDLFVRAGQEVGWTNRDGQTHTVSAGTPDLPGGEFESGDMPQGGVWEHTFNTPGLYPYYCRYHPSMRATITVQ